MRFMPPGKIHGAVFLIMLAFAASAAAQGVGAISGTVTDSSGGVMPGANVTLTNVQGAVGGNQTAVTNELGTYQFLRLVPGTYVVKAELQGFRPAEARNIIVNSDLNARADLKLEVGAMSEGVTVTGQAPLLDTSVALKQTVISRAQLEELPNRTDVWSVAKVIPGVILSKVDVGGSEGFLQSGITVRGGSSGNKFTIDGMDVSSLDGNASIATMYLDPASFQESNFMLGQGSAESGNGGMTINMVTRTGTNQLHGGGGVPGATWGRMARARNFTTSREPTCSRASRPMCYWSTRTSARAPTSITARTSASGSRDPSLKTSCGTPGPGMTSGSCSTSWAATTPTARRCPTTTSCGTPR